MAQMNVFDRTALFQKEKKDIDPSRQRIKRIPWDFIGHGDTGFFVSPMPVDMNPFQDILTTTTLFEPNDMDADNEGIDEVVGIMYFESEQDFYSRFDCVFGYYKTTDPSTEFGYPRS